MTFTEGPIATALGVLLLAAAIGAISSLLVAAMQMPAAQVNGLLGKAEGAAEETELTISRTATTPGDAGDMATTEPASPEQTEEVSTTAEGSADLEDDGLFFGPLEFGIEDGQSTTPVESSSANDDGAGLVMGGYSSSAKGQIIRTIAAPGILKTRESTQGQVGGVKKVRFSVATTNKTVRFFTGRTVTPNGILKTRESSKPKAGCAVTVSLNGSPIVSRVCAVTNTASPAGILKTRDSSAGQAGGEKKVRFLIAPTTTKTVTFAATLSFEPSARKAATKLRKQQRGGRSTKTWMKMRALENSRS